MLQSRRNKCKTQSIFDLVEKVYTENIPKLVICAVPHGLTIDLHNVIFFIEGVRSNSKMCFSLKKATTRNIITTERIYQCTCI